MIDRKIKFKKNDTIPQKCSKNKFNNVYTNHQTMNKKFLSFLLF